MQNRQITTVSRGVSAERSTGTLERSDRQVLNLTFNAEIPQMDISKATSFLSATLFTNLMEGLFRFTSAGQLVPALAKSWNMSSDGLTYTFSLREAQWSSGEQVTAHDFVYSYLRTLDPVTESQYAAMMTFLRGGRAYHEGSGLAEDVGVCALDDWTLQVQLESPVPFFLDLLAFPVFFPQQRGRVEAMGKQYGTEAEWVLSNGPYRMSEWLHGQRITLTKSDTYWDAEHVAMQQIHFHIIKDTDVSAQMYEAGDLDCLLLIGEHAKRYQESPELRVVSELRAGFLQYSQRVPVLQNAKVRQALSYAVDGDAVARDVYQQGAKGATGFVPDGLSNGQEGEFRQDVGDLILHQERLPFASQLLADGMAELGLTEFPTLSLLASDDDIGLKSTASLVEQWKTQLGIDVRAENVGYHERLQRSHIDHDFDIVLSHWGADYNDPMSFVELFVTGHEFNNPEWSNMEYDLLVEQARYTVDPQERMQCLMDAERLLMQELPIMPLYFCRRLFLVKPYVQNFRWQVYGPFYELKETYISRSH